MWTGSRFVSLTLSNWEWKEINLRFHWTKNSGFDFRQEPQLGTESVSMQLN